MGETYSVTAAMVAWLEALGYAASVRPPGEDAPAEFVTVERVGGGVSSLVDRPSVAVRCWAPTEARSEEMALAVRRAALTAPPPAGVHSMRVDAGPYPLYDEETHTPRHQLVLDLACRI